MLACLRPVYTGDFSGHPVPHVSFSAFYFFSFSPTFCWLVAFVRIPVSPRPLRPPTSPRFYPLQAQHWCTNTRSKYLLFTSFTLKRSGFPMHLLLRNSLTRSLHRMPNSHDPLPTSPSPTPPHPPVFTYNRHSTGIWIPVQNISIWISNRRGIAASLHPRKRAWNRR